MNFLITNSVPLNGGDEALLRVVVRSLKQRWPDGRVTALCSGVELLREFIADVDLFAGVEFVRTADELRQAIRLYRDADVVLSAPGGFLQDHYEIAQRLDGLEFALDTGKPVIVLPQSMGPFWREDSRRRVGEVLSRVTRVFVRDRSSAEQLLDCGVPADRIVEAADAAFLWRRLEPSLFRSKTSESGTIGLCFREWPLGDSATTRETVAKARALCEHLLKAPGHRLRFISTCQGIGGYVDDSKIAKEIVRGLPEILQQRCEIYSDRLSSERLISKLAECDAVVSMRLHVCILSLLGGTPAFGLGYESKTEQIFGQLDLGRYQLDFRAGFEQWLTGINGFLSDLEQVRARLPVVLDAMCASAETVFDEIARLSRLQDDRPANDSPGVDHQANGALRSERIDRYLTKSYDSLRWRQWSAQAANELDALVPQDDSLILIDDLQLPEEIAPGRKVTPFLECNGQYGGPPPDSQTAIAELQRLKHQEIRYVVLGWPSFWWIEEYPQFFEYLETHATVLQNDRLRVYDLRPELARGRAQRSHPALNSEVDRCSIIDRIRNDHLTYLSAGALFDLHAAVIQVEEAGLAGCLIEAGVALGGSALLMTSAKSANRPLLAYDVFGMIPAPATSEAAKVQARYEEIRSGAAKGIGGDTYYGYEADLYERVAENFDRYELPLDANRVELIRGEFQASLIPPGPVALAHIDCDWYDSVRVCLERIEPLLVPGGTLIIDDYYRWPGCAQAVDEFFSDRRARYRFQVASRLHITKLC